MGKNICDSMNYKMLIIKFIIIIYYYKIGTDNLIKIKLQIYL